MPAASKDPLQKQRRLLRQLSKSPKPDQVHGFRTTARRIEALLAARLEQPGKNERKLLKQMAKVRRRAGRVRDLDVQISNLEALNIGREAECKALVFERLKGRRKKALKRLLGALDGGTVQRIEKRLARAARKVSRVRSAAGSSNPGKVPDTAQAIAGRLQKLQSKLPLSEETLHEYRLRGKRMRYTLELSRDPQATKLVDQLKEMQDAIGKWHDSVVLLESAQAAINHNGSCPLIAALRNLSKAQLWQALQITRGTLAGLAGASSPRKPTRKASPMMAAASA
jgi:CHAD domain-containing protein